MFDWLFKMLRTEKSESDQLDDEIVKLRKKINSVKSSCLYDDEKLIEPLKQRIDELKAKRSGLRYRQRKKAIDALNTFPLHTPCTLTHISEMLDIGWWDLHNVMFSIEKPYRCSPKAEYVLTIDNWREVKYDGRTYLERIE